jgi:hypothetical protein
MWLAQLDVEDIASVLGVVALLRHRGHVAGGGGEPAIVDLRVSFGIERKARRMSRVSLSALRVKSCCPPTPLSVATRAFRKPCATKAA